MSRTIAYLKQPEEYVKSYNNPKIASVVLASNKYFDYAGSVAMPSEIFLDRLQKFPKGVQKKLLKMSNEKDRIFHLRSNDYYLNYKHCNDIEKVRDDICSGLLELPEIINQIKDINSSDLETRLILSSFLDLKKHYSMCVFNAYFMAALRGNVDKSRFEEARDVFIKDVDAFYRFLLTGVGQKPGCTAKEYLNYFKKELIMPKSTPSSKYKFEGEPAAQKLMIREMDHPMQILFFGGELLQDDKSDQIEIVANPLSGAIGVGYALKTLYSILGLNKIGDIFLLKYSRYGEGNEPGDLTEFVPYTTPKELDKKLKNKHIFVIDDNAFRGITLKHLKRMFKKYSSKVDIAVIERLTSEKRTKHVNLEDLAIKPISKLRYTGFVQEYVRENNLKK